ncbi:YciK family oxidoreductase [Alkalilimnicola ehrlichii]|uniref:YciK family oxidoreductase n=1 Tax=Alkalilimnicola ehrlichii TaxID=351052 RepID=A0A3E0WVC5_9GAMM|nr:YciK family oxidoreductase [Alkalilimnicola ehrlichii]RFA27811.1 YciK family oxidoreductase [Alkalilimnicola ehrlichii]RFA36942.1 YciK family oxidoreductase [Alkalilimnicola ehrlichii]
MTDSQDVKTIPANYAAPDALLDQRVMLITGAGDGIGKALSLAAARAGATVVLLDRNVRKLELVYDQIEADGGPQPAIYPLNLETATPEHYHELAATLDNNFGGLDILVHNAATLGRLAPLELSDVGLWFSTMQVNLTAPFLLTQALLPLMRKGEHGSILFLGDSVGRRGKAYWGSYGVAKFGLEGLMQILAEEVASSTSLRVNSIDPGPVRTNLRNTAYPAENKDRLPEPEDIVGAMLYLFSPEGRNLHGEMLRIER